MNHDFEVIHLNTKTLPGGITCIIVNIHHHQHMQAAAESRGGFFILLSSNDAAVIIIIEEYFMQKYILLILYNFFSLKKRNIYTIYIMLKKSIIFPCWIRGHLILTVGQNQGTDIWVLKSPPFLCLWNGKKRKCCRLLPASAPPTRASEYCRQNRNAFRTLKMCTQNWKWLGEDEIWENMWLWLVGVVSWDLLSSANLQRKAVTA